MQIPTPLQFSQSGKFEFHISRAAREKYQFQDSIYTLNGNVILADFRAARLFAQQMNALRSPDSTLIRAGQINAMGLIDEILHLILGQYKQQVKPEVMTEALEWLNTRIDPQAIDQALGTFATLFPASKVYQKDQPLEDYFKGETSGVPNKLIILEEMLMLWLANANPAFSPYLELFSDVSLTNQTVYSEIIHQLDQFFNYQPTFGPFNQQLITMLRSPAVASPNSLEGQLAYIRQHWAGLLGDHLIRLLTSLDLIAEEHKASFTGPGPVEVYDYYAWGASEAPERFSADSDWMPRLVLLAKNAYVWLDQLSNQYQRSIRHLDQIPDEELDRIARQGITGLWLIGLWRRGKASQKIKQMMGDPEAIASAYSLDDYVIADELGGPQAASNLRDRAIRRGIRLGGDMVPNHMAIDSRWVTEHPQWFLSLDHSPFPNYSYNGPNLSPREGVGIYLEDHYYSRSDAAVVFKRADFHSGEERFIYHGNDGTNMPWNDTAQLNFTLPEVREGVIQTILHVARQFSIIRFDAAMTLAKQHIQRLWFPPPGSGGAIPSRAGQGMTEEEFDQAIPVEFWREVVDRVAQEQPDTLLLAEAFWMMEGYFVRTLGMHRVYNSAFMHMLRDEKNAQYRQLIKNTLEYNPQILKRYVNFMNNPDEETAVEQFGKGDKYFGVATLMATLPGLPMVGHGQIEGFSEKYGMEYHKAKWEEKPDLQLTRRHQEQIFPLFHRRRLYAEVENFLLYDFFTGSGYVNEDVFAFSNKLGDQRSLVVYHNRFGDTRGWIRTSAGFLDSTENDGEKVLRQRSLAEGLDIPNAQNCYVIFRNLITNMEYIRNCAEIHEKGLFFELFAYQTYVFLDFRFVYDASDGRYARVNAYLGGKPVPSIEEALQEMFLQIIHTPYRELINAGMLNFLVNSLQKDYKLSADALPLDQVEQKSLRLIRAIASFLGTSPDVTSIAHYMRIEAGVILQLPILNEQYPPTKFKKIQVLADRVNDFLGSDRYNWTILFTTAFTSSLGLISSPHSQIDAALISQSWFDEWLLRKVIQQESQNLGLSEMSANYVVKLVRLLIGQRSWIDLKAPKKIKPLALVTAWLEDPAIRDFLKINTFNDTEWFNWESMELWLHWMRVIGLLDILVDDRISSQEKPGQLVNLQKLIEAIEKALSRSDYQVEKLLENLKG
jgi:glycosidase